jgi:hypothetical protein
MVLPWGISVLQYGLAYLVSQWQTYELSLSHFSSVKESGLLDEQGLVHLPGNALHISSRYFHPYFSRARKTGTRPGIHIPERTALAWHGFLQHILGAIPGIHKAPQTRISVSPP